MPLGVLFRGNAEADIRKKIIQKGYIKGIIGLPPNLFYGTGIAACLIVIDKENQTVYLSAIFEATWPGYGKEFMKKYQTDKKFKSHKAATRAVLNFVTNYLPENDVVFLETGNYDVKFQPFDWTVND